MDGKKIAILGALLAGTFLFARRASAATPGGSSPSSFLPGLTANAGGGTGTSAGTSTGTGGYLGSIFGTPNSDNTAGAPAPSLSSTLSSVLKALSTPAPAPSFVTPTAAPVLDTTPAVAYAAAAAPATPGLIDGGMRGEASGHTYTYGEAIRQDDYAYRQLFAPPTDGAGS